MHMTGLSLDQFLSAGPDFEGAQYRILNRLQLVRQAFSRNIIYPHLGELVNLYGTLRTIVGRLDDLREALPGRIKGIDLKSQTVQYEKPKLAPDQMGFVEDLIQWALPLIQEAIEEGRTIFEFVEDHLRLEEVGLLPAYVEEGYLLLPDLRAERLHVLQYQLSIFTRADERFRSLKTTHIKSLPQSTIVRSPRGIKLELVQERRQLPNPATYVVESAIDFPYEQTLLPIAKRKLMRHLSAQTGQA